MATPTQLRFYLKHGHLALTVNGSRAARSQPAMRFLLALLNALWFRKGAPAVTLAEFDYIERQNGRSKLDHKAMSRVLTAVDGMGLGPTYELATPHSRRTTGPWVLATAASHWNVEFNDGPLDASTLAAFFNSAETSVESSTTTDLAIATQQLLNADGDFDKGHILDSLTQYQTAASGQSPLFQSLLHLREIKALRHLERREDIESLVASIRTELNLVEHPLREYLLAQLKLMEVWNVYQFDDNPASGIQTLERLEADTVVRTAPTLASQASTLLGLSYRKLARRLAPAERRSLLGKALQASESAVTYALATHDVELLQNVFTNHGIISSALALDQRHAQNARAEAGIQALHWVILSGVVGTRWQVGSDTMWDAVVLLGIAADHGVELHQLRSHPLTRSSADCVFGDHADLTSYAEAQLAELKQRRSQCPLSGDMPIQAAFLLVEIAWRSLSVGRRLSTETLAELESALGHAQDDQREIHLWRMLLALKTLRSSRQALNAARNAIARGVWRIDVLRLIGESSGRLRRSGKWVDELCRRIDLLG